jgi:ribose transport system ATP-binding protein
VLALADRISVMRDGRNAGELSRADASYDKIVALMVGRELSSAYFPVKIAKEPGDVMLEVQDLLVPGAPAGVSFSARRGEILGFAGLVGSGRTELMETLFGVTPARAGSMTVEGRSFAPQTPRDAILRDVYLVPEDRKRNGLVLQMSVAENASLPSTGKRARFGLVDRRGDQRLAQKEVERLRIKTPSIQQKVVTLSGGNQQKVVLGKWLAMSPKVLILDEPTRGIDVGAKAEIYRHVAELAAQGIAILMVSSDMEEVIGMSDRVIVMHERRFTGELERAEFTEQRIASLMTGKLTTEGATGT